MTTTKWIRAGLLMLAGGVCCGWLGADCGSIPMTEKLVDVFEPNQRALIAWNGQEEILILSTDLYSSEPTKVLEVIPMPSEPKVTPSDVKVFTEAVAVLNTKLPKKKVLVAAGGSGSTFGGTGGGGESEEVPPVAEISFHEKIGATDVSVVHVLNGKGFIEWVEDFLKGQNVKNPVIPAILKTTVNEYVADGYEWFAFNIVSLDKTVKSKQAVQYRFKTDCLFYPMRISRTDKGSTSISLTVLTKEPFDNLKIMGVPDGRLKVAYDVFDATESEIRGISKDVYALLGPYGQYDPVKLRVWETTGELKSFNEDIVAGPERTFSLSLQLADKPEVVYGPFPLKRDAKIQLDKDNFSLVLKKQEQGKPFEFALKRDWRRGVQGAGESPAFHFADGAKVVLDNQTFTLKIGKSPVAKDPAAKKGKKTLTTRPGSR